MPQQSGHAHVSSRMLFDLSATCACALSSAQRLSGIVGGCVFLPITVKGRRLCHGVPAPSAEYASCQVTCQERPSAQCLRNSLRLERAPGSDRLSRATSSSASVGMQFTVYCRRRLSNHARDILDLSRRRADALADYDRSARSLLPFGREVDHDCLCLDRLALVMLQNA